MSVILVNHIKIALDKIFVDKIDLSDKAKDSPEEKERAFYARALAAYSLHALAGATIDESVNAVTDGFKDNGIDAIFYDEQQDTLYLVQSKMIYEGKGEPDVGDMGKYMNGITDLISEKYDRFNAKINKKVPILQDAFDNSRIRMNIILAYTGKGFAEPNKQLINDILEDLNESSDWVYFTDFNLKALHGTLDTVLDGNPINSEISLSNWGSIDEPYPAYYGLISAYDLALLWKNNRKKLFAENIRNFIGLSEINIGILKTIENEPQNFVYYNNGVTVLCQDILPLPARTVGKTTGLFECKGISIINGAQTVGSLGIAIDKYPEQLKLCKVFIRLIPMNKCPSDFGITITKNSNTQNKIEKRDFVSLDPYQSNLRTELLLDGINYHYKRSDEYIPFDDKNCTLEEATVALACFQDDSYYAVTAKREVGRFWDDLTSAPYKTIFSDSLKPILLWRSVQVYRVVSKYLSDNKVNKSGRESSTYTFSNYFTLSIVFALIPKECFMNPNYDFNQYISAELNQLTSTVIGKVFEIAEQEYPNSYIHQLYRNYTKCNNMRKKVLASLEKK
jgi:hypothetical protein